MRRRTREAVKLATMTGQLVGALERMESGGTLRMRDALSVTNEAGTGDL